MTPRLSGHFSIFGLVFFVLKSLLGIARQWILEKFAILTLKPRSHVRILMYRAWAIAKSLIFCSPRLAPVRRVYTTTTLLDHETVKVCLK